MMNTDKIRKMFLDTSAEKIAELKGKLEEIKKKDGDIRDDLVHDSYILAHSLHSSSVYLPIRGIILFAKAMENNVKEWLEDGFVLNNQKVDEFIKDVDKLKTMIDNIDDYFGDTLK